MLRKTTAAVVLAGALALGTASATSLGTFNDVSFAASDVGLQACTAGDIDLIPSVPTTGDDVDTLLEAFQLESIVLSTVTDACEGKFADLALLNGANEVLAVVENITVAEGTPINLGLVNLTPTGPSDVIDITQIQDVHIVLKDSTA